MCLLCPEHYWLKVWPEHSPAHVAQRHCPPDPRSPDWSPAFSAARLRGGAGPRALFSHGDNMAFDTVLSLFSHGLPAAP